uniref:Like moricin n=2 Tax=Manduca sexta TaxID=7130 RepID=Q0VJV2_MANSE|nr:like moricin [Manduca sexta]
MGDGNHSPSGRPYASLPTRAKMKLTSLFIFVIVALSLLFSSTDAAPGKIPVKAIKQAGKVIVSTLRQIQLIISLLCRLYCCPIMSQWTANVFTCVNFIIAVNCILISRIAVVLLSFRFYFLFDLIPKVVLSTQHSFTQTARKKHQKSFIYHIFCCRRFWIIFIYDRLPLKQYPSYGYVFIYFYCNVLFFEGKGLRAINIAGTTHDVVSFFRPKKKKHSWTRSCWSWTRSCWSWTRSCWSWTWHPRLDR